ncbi:MAG: hypothetical protein U1F43_09585 [Myxococcota bacterium]
MALLVGCGGDPGAGPELGDALDGIDPGDVVVDAADVIDDTSSGDSLTAPDAADAPDSDDGDDGDDGRDTMPGPCPSGEACNDLLVEGACRATCVPIDDVLRCPGVVVDGVCHGSDPRVADPTETTIDDLVVTTVAAPSGPTAVGEVIHLELSVANASDHDVSLPFGASWSRPGT